VAGAVRARFPDGVWIVELAALAEPTLTASTVAAALGLRIEEGRPPVETVVGQLRSARLLLLLDNCEHLSRACAELVETLLHACPSVQVLATSREPLGLTGEYCWMVHPLTLPRSPSGQAAAPVTGPSVDEQAGIRAVLASEAGQLFVERARAVRRTLTLTDEAATAVARICRQLDGIPLAIELAAAWVAALAPAEIATRLDDRFGFLARSGRTALPRQRTLRESVDWSHDLLSETERILLRRLAVFRGGWTLAAVEDVGFRDSSSGEEHPPAESRIPKPESLDVLAALVEKSLVLAELGLG
jgi:predicted ATPase